MHVLTMLLAVWRGFHLGRSIFHQFTNHCRDSGIFTSPVWTWSKISHCPNSCLVYINHSHAASGRRKLRQAREKSSHIPGNHIQLFPLVSLVQTEKQLLSQFFEPVAFECGWKTNHKYILSIILLTIHIIFFSQTPETRTNKNIVGTAPTYNNCMHTCIYM